MTTKLSAPLKRELAVDGETYTLTISLAGLKLVPKGRRKGQELAWRDFVSGDAALAAGLNASLNQYPGHGGKKPAAATDSGSGSAPDTKSVLRMKRRMRKGPG